MTDLKTVLFEFWSQFGVPAYLSDCVPPDAVLPYITFSVSKSPAIGTSLLTVHNYHAKWPSGNVDRAEMADRIADAIPENGVKLELANGGFIAMYRNTDFQTDYQDPEDLDVLGVRTSVEVHFYCM